MSNYVTAAKEPMWCKPCVPVRCFCAHVAGYANRRRAPEISAPAPWNGSKRSTVLAVIIPLHHSKLRCVSVVVP